MATTIDYLIRIGGDFKAKLDQLSQGLEDGDKKARSLADRLVIFEKATSVLRNVTQGIADLSRAGVSLDSQMHDLSAVAGVTGDNLKLIEGYARESAKAFGTDASEAVTGYKLLLSQLSPELGKYPEALKAMGDNIQTTAKLMGGDGVAAAEVLTTAMNQYGVSLDDPMKASEEMARMMNVMAAAGQAGSAELPAIKVALEQCGMAAKSAGVSFEETNAAIQVLDKAGKKGSEGGVALRNVMATLSQGRFLPKDVQKELSAAGVDVLALGDKSKSLKERLEMLRPVMQDSALFSKLFGRENANAALALVGGTEALGDFTEAVTGTTSAEEQAKIVMDSYAERQARVRQRFEDIKIAAFQATGDLTLWASTIGESLVPLSQLLPLLTGVGNLLGKAWPIACAAARIGFSLLKTGAVSACRAITVAIGSIPIVGWVAIAITALVSLGVYFWNTSVKFRAILKGLGAMLVQFFVGQWELAKNVFGGIKDLLIAAFTLNPKGIADALKKVTGSYVDFGKSIGKAFKSAYDEEMKSAKKAPEKKAQTKTETKNDPLAGIAPGSAVATDTNNPTGNTLGNVSGGGSGSSSGSSGSGIRNVTIRVDKLIERLELHTTTIREGADRIEAAVTQALMNALNDVSLAV